VILDGVLYFSSFHPETGEELWKSDGTESGTVLLKDIHPGTSHFSLWKFTRAGPLVFIDDVSALWRSDGTPEGTFVVKSGPTLETYATVGSTLYFKGHDKAAGYELWKSDGTAAGTVRVKDIAPGTAGSYPTGLVAVGGRVFFNADDGVHGAEAWHSDGTSTGTTMVGDIFWGKRSSDPEDFVHIGGHTYFISKGHLWTTDGTSRGTILLKEASNQFTTILGGGSHAYFLLNKGTTNELWRTDGTVVGTKFVKAVPEMFFGWAMVGSNYLFFQKEPGTGYGLGYGVWKTDGTEKGTVLVKKFDGIPAGLIRVGSKVFFSVDRGVYKGRELWTTDGTPAGSAMIKLIGAEGYSGSVTAMVEFGGQCVFHESYTGLWISDGTAEGTTLILPTHSELTQFAVAGAYLYFSVANSVLYKTDGTPEGTQQVKAVKVGIPVALGSKLYFNGSANGDGAGSELWTSDGTAAGTRLVKDIYQGSMSGSPYPLVVIGDKLYFGAENEFGSKLWTSDGTEAGTVIVPDLPEDTEIFQPRSLQNCGGILYFSAISESTGREPYALGDGLPAPAPEITLEQPEDTTLVKGASRNFGNVAVGATKDLEFLIGNAGTVDLEGLDFSIAGSGKDHFQILGASEEALAPGAIGKFAVRFTPESAGVKSALLRIASNDDYTGIFEVTVEGSGLLPLPEIEVRAEDGRRLTDGKAKVAFGGWKVGIPGLVQTFTIRNTGNGLLTGISIVKEGAQAGDFAVSKLKKTTLAPNASVKFNVTFKPLGKGVRTAFLRIKSSDENESPFDLRLSGKGAK
jgi:ELWxxDGT repeat protein